MLFRCSLTSMASLIIWAMYLDMVHTSEMSIYFHETAWLYILEGCHLHTCHLENLKSHKTKLQKCDICKTLSYTTLLCLLCSYNNNDNNDDNDKDTKWESTHLL
jgi:hypothetical protein